MTKIIIGVLGYGIACHLLLGSTVGGLLFAGTVLGCIGLNEYHKRARTNRRRAFQATIERPTIDM